MLACVFASVAVYMAYQGADGFKISAWLIACVGVGGIAIFAPQRLALLTNTWMRLGDCMGKVISPLVLGAMFFLLLTPIGLTRRLFGRDELRLKKTDLDTYWVERSPPGPNGESFKDQF